MAPSQRASPMPTATYCSCVCADAFLCPISAFADSRHTMPYRHMGALLSASFVTIPGSRIRFGELLIHSCHKPIDSRLNCLTHRGDHGVDVTGHDFRGLRRLASPHRRAASQLHQFGG